LFPTHLAAPSPQGASAAHPLVPLPLGPWAAVAVLPAGRPRCFRQAPRAPPWGSASIGAALGHALTAWPPAGEPAALAAPCSLPWPSPTAPCPPGLRRRHLLPCARPSQSSLSVAPLPPPPSVPRAPPSLFLPRRGRGRFWALCSVADGYPRGPSRRSWHGVVTRTLRLATHQLVLCQH
jgi:hypothetical protein